MSNYTLEQLQDQYSGTYECDGCGERISNKGFFSDKEEEILTKYNAQFHRNLELADAREYDFCVGCCIAINEEGSSKVADFLKEIGHFGEDEWIAYVEDGEY